MVVVDTSVWVQAFRVHHSQERREVDRLLASEEVAMVGPVLAEILQGVRTLPEYEKLQGQVGQVPYLEETSDTWNKVGSLSYQLRRQGMALVLVDLLIASLALENDFELYTLDEHFQRIPGLRLHTPNEAD